MKSIRLLLLPVLFLSTGCLSLTSLQSGRTLGNGNVSLAISATLGKPVTASEGERFFVTPNNGFHSALEMQGGFGKTTDLRFHADQQLNLGLGLKQQIWGGEYLPFAGSIGLDAGFGLGAFFLARINTYITVPLYTSYELRDNFTLCFTPRYLYQNSKNRDADTTASMVFNNSSNLLGLSYGFLWGRKEKFGLEVSNFEGPFFKPSQITAGFVFTF